jgi:hypothetical protein
LQTLTNISYHPYLSQHVYTVASGTEQCGTVDSLHEEEAKRNSVQHSKPTAPTMSALELKKMRGRFDALAIAHSFARLPKLKLTMLDHHLEVDGQPVRPSWG